MKKLKTSLWFLIFGSVGYAQEATLSAGSDVQSSSGSVSYSIGQITYATHQGMNGSSAQGVQQPFEIMTTVGIEITEIQLKLDVHPNPTTNSLQLTVEGELLKNLSYQLIDATGRIITEQKISSDQTQIIMSELPAASYFLAVLDGNHLIKNFKIIKN